VKLAAIKISRILKGPVGQSLITNMLLNAACGSQLDGGKEYLGGNGDVL